MILGQEKTDSSNIKLEFGQFCQVYEKTRNNMTPRIVGGIALIPINDRGSYFLMSLETGRRIYVRQWTVLRITESVMGRVDKLDTKEGINKMVD